MATDSAVPIAISFVDVNLFGMSEGTHAVKEVAPDSGEHFVQLVHQVGTRKAVYLAGVRIRIGLKSPRARIE